jgi:thiol:disulfide interchange protein DsbA
MTMDRREFSCTLAGGLGLGLIAAPLARAQGNPVEGRQYVRLSQPAETQLPPGKKVEVVEFFWYGCPHCNAFEPELAAWVAKLPADVSFRHVPAGFTALWQVGQKVFYALEAMGQEAALRSRIFAAIHVQRERLNSEASFADWLAANGVDRDKFVAAYRSFSVNAKVTQARQLADAYKIDGVPAMGVQGRFYTAGGMAGGNAQMLRVVDYLIAQSR